MHIAVYQLQQCYFLADLLSPRLKEKAFEVYGVVVENWWHYGIRRREEGLMGQQQKDHTDHRGYSWDYRDKGNKGTST